MEKRRSLKLVAALPFVLLAVACSSASAPTAVPTATGSSALPHDATASIPATLRPSASPRATQSGPRSSLPALPDGPIEPGRYTYVVDNGCDDPACPVEGRPPSPLEMEVTVPAGYMTLHGFPVIAVDTPSGTNGPDGGALVLGWTSFWIGLNSDPCLPVGHVVTDIEVGPTVDDFVEAVLAHPELDVTEPADVELGGYQGKFFSLTGPSDISGCDNWRPWDPGFYVQGPDNHWDVWVIDAGGFRVLIVNEYFPETPDDIKSELREMAESIRFIP
jgi:hypothetical protein